MGGYAAPDQGGADGAEGADLASGQALRALRRVRGRESQREITAVEVSVMISRRVMIVVAEM